MESHLSFLQIHPLRVLGWLLVLGFALWMGLAIRGYWRRLRLQEQQARLEMQLLQARLEGALVQNRLQQERVAHSWSGIRKFRVAAKRPETPDVQSLDLVPHDGKPLPPFEAGQYLTLQLRIPGHRQPLIRCYSLSSHPRALDSYRITVKRLAPDPQAGTTAGLVSDYLCNQVVEGDILDVKSIAGHFVLDPGGSGPVVLIAGGIGVTAVLPKLWMLCEAVESREVWLFHGVPNGAVHMLKGELEQVAREHENAHIRFCYSRPLAGEVPGRDYHHVGRIDLALLKQFLPSNNYEFHVCGPAGMMDDLVQGLADWGVPKQDIHYEAFGPSSLGRKPAVSAGDDAGHQVVFTRSGRSVTWTPDSGALLDLADQHGVALEGGCRAGNCGTCMVAVKKGQVAYPHEPGFTPDAGSCLACIAIPKSDLEVDA
ncbi:MAG: 2Fe-2S iron-sulfur cluster binding domain-containing protein [Magnetococcales bacterium]|nr:2Fe-2S iron-sulfur cluster binding domain-containing protein [Magnetococcales bacterium]